MWHHSAKQIVCVRYLALRDLALKPRLLPLGWPVDANERQDRPRIHVGVVVVVYDNTNKLIEVE